ncbi:DUF3152 domain-containing protein [Streptomyces sp. NPDC001480]|uniref:DUF3152 domain-containing protein n=1 Tax=Streptomyces sp. NPDC001480 TaxID=3364577 RepID=UPI003685A7B5
MGRHSRRGKAPKGDSGSAATTAQTSGGSRTGQGAARDEREPGAAPGVMPGGRPGAGPVPGQRRAPMDGGPGHGVPRRPDGAPAQGVPRMPDGTPARGVPRMQEGSPARGMPRMQDGTQTRDVPRTQDGTPAGGAPRFPGAAPDRGVPRTRGGHPEQREPGGGWGEFAGRGEGGRDARSGAAGPGAAVPRQRLKVSGGPRKEYLDAFDGRPDEDDDVFAPRKGTATRRTETYVPAPTRAPGTTGADDDAPAAGEPAQTKRIKGRTFTGIAAAAVTTVLAVIVAGQVTDGKDDGAPQSRSATDGSRDARDSASGGDEGVTSPGSPNLTTLTYDQKMADKYPLSATLKGPGKFDAVPGAAKAPGKGHKYTYRVDVEQGLGLDGELFAEAVQKTLNDDRSWAHGGARTFERVSSGKPDFVITLASPGTTAAWCAKSGLDTTEDNVSCDSAATERVMINAYRWAQGSKTYGDKIHAYRQMLINHEVGHRLGYGHVTCDKNGELAPVMQQQTKFLNHDGIHCLPNPWPYPRS